MHRYGGVVLMLSVFLSSALYAGDMEPKGSITPERYICYRTSQPVEVDGRLDEAAWQNALWTERFVDIEGDLKPRPRFGTRAKMLWDDTYFYVAAQMEEPDVWATLTQRDAVIFQDNDFEVFVDPDGDTHQYYEFEMNALNTQWDLLLVKAYRDGGPAMSAWDIAGLRSAVDIQGTLNRSGDADEGWSLEIAFPWRVLRECAHRPSPPEDGDQWRVNFSRVQYYVDVADSAYQKRKDPQTGRDLPCDNWVWSPQGLIDMHCPEMWGYVQFAIVEAGAAPVSFVPRPEETAKGLLRKVYYRQRTYHQSHGRFTRIYEHLGLEGLGSDLYTWPPVIQVTESGFEAWTAEKRDLDGDGLLDRWHIREDSRVWRSR